MASSTVQEVCGEGIKDRSLFSLRFSYKLSPIVALLVH